MRAVKRVVEQPGTVQAFEETALLAKIPGYVGSIADDPDKKDRLPHDRQIDIGSRVKHGQVLAELTVPELDTEAKQKRAMAAQARAEVVQSEKALAAAEAGVVVAHQLVTEAEAGIERAQAIYDRWQSEVMRIEKLVAEGVDVRQTLDETRSQFKASGATKKEATAKVTSARAAVQKAEADRAKAAADVDAAKARLDVTLADVERVDALRGYMKIKAPFDGVVTSRTVNTGDYVTGNEKSALFTVTRMDPVRVVVRVPEADADLVAAGQDVQITLQSSVRAGKVVRTSWALEKRSRTLRTEIDLPNKDGDLRPAMYVSAKVTVELPAAWAVPATAVGMAANEPVIYLAANGKANRVPVQLLRGDGQFTQLRRYKKPGSTDWVEFTGGESIATPASALTDGQEVH